jgi:nucleotide-binding universal stress UspA family protein
MRRPAPFEHVFLATDFSKGAGRAVARAGRLPLSERGRITVVHVLSDRIPKNKRRDAQELARRQIEQSCRAIGRTVAGLGRRDIKVSSELCQGRAYVELIRHARSVGADLMIVGRHGRRPVRDMFLGSVAERVIRAGDLPVLVVNRRAGGSYRRPLVAVDLEDTCRSVITLALRALGPELTSAAMVHAYHVPFEGFINPGARPGEKTALREEYRLMAVSGLDRILESLGDFGVRWQTAIVRGDPRGVILAEADRRRTDLLVVGTHGRSGIAHALLGSVAEWVIHAATCDLLVARPSRVSFEFP